MSKRTDAETQSAISRWCLAIVAASLVVCVIPPVGAFLWVILGWSAVRQISASMRAKREQRAREQYVMWRGTQADLSGLPIEERNAYRRAANALPRNNMRR